MIEEEEEGERTMRTILEKWQNRAPELQSILRIVAAFMFMQAGTMKLFAFPVGIFPNGGTVSLMSELGLAAVLEVFGGGLMLLGFLTRPVAFVLSGEMAVAYFQAHFPHGFWPVLNGGQPAIFYCFAWLYFSSAGPGPWSLDVLWRRYRTIGRGAERQS